MSFINSAFFEGSWSLERSVSNNTSMIGEAFFSVIAENRLNYLEKGSMILPHQVQLPFERCYLYEIEPNALTIFFEDHRLFQHIPLAIGDHALYGDAVHYCVDDVYRSHYTFYPDHRFNIRHIVSGPHKDYSILTHFIKRLPCA
jgi:Family of unknown function (DUF6314)